MEEKEKKMKHKKHKPHHPNNGATKPASLLFSADFAFKRSSEVKGLRFRGQIIVKFFTISRARPLELLKALSFPPTKRTAMKKTGYNSNDNVLPFPSTTAYMPTNFTILAHHAWHTLMLGLGTRKSKVVVFVFDSEKPSVDRSWPSEIPLGDVDKRLIGGMTGYEMVQFKFWKGCITFYVYAVRQTGIAGFARGNDLRVIMESVVELKDFLDHNVMLAMPNQRSISFSNP